MPNCSTQKAKGNKDHKTTTTNINTQCVLSHLSLKLLYQNQSSGAMLKAIDINMKANQLLTTVEFGLSNKKTDSGRRIINDPINHTNRKTSTIRVTYFM